MNSILKVDGPQRPCGTIAVSGAKNAATRMMAAAMLTNQPVTLPNFPTTLVDVGHKATFMRALGAEVLLDEKMSLAALSCAQIEDRLLDHYRFPIRTTYLLAAGQLHRHGIARIPYPGGCQLGVGERKHDLHIMVWERLGCQVEEKLEYIEIRGKLRGGEVHFPLSTVGGTENALLCASVAEGHSSIQNAYVTPEIENLIELLRLMGADITMTGLSRIDVRGQPELRGASLPVIPDRIEALTWIIWAAISGGEILINNVPFPLMEIPLVHLRKAGLDFFANSQSVYVSPATLRGGGLQPFEVACGTHPGIISDMQPFLVLLALHADGRSLIFDYRYPERTAYLEQLARMYRGALQWERGKISVNGLKTPQGADVISTDLRGSMALLMAAFQAQGSSTVQKIQMAMRGYDRLEEKMRELGLMFAPIGGAVEES
jgi:UDP-N-acetylglucosamine 1-carboxyvinyltransferase